MNVKLSSLSSQQKETLGSVNSQNLKSLNFSDNSEEMSTDFNAEVVLFGDDDYRKINVSSFKRSFSRLQKNYLSENRKSKKDSLR